MLEGQEADVGREQNALAAVTILIMLGMSAVACGDGEATSVTDPALAGATTSTTIETVATSSSPPTNTPVTTSSATPPATTTATSAPVEVTVIGVVISVDGTLGATNSFTIRLEDGSDLTLVPADGLLFDGVSPVSHVRDHLVSGSPVRITYTTPAEGPFLAIEIGDAGGGERNHEN